MKCTDAQALIDRHLDGELSVDEAIQLGEHFALCAECKALSTELKSVCGAVKTIPDLPAEEEDSVSAKTVAVLRREGPATRPVWRKWWMLGTLGAAAAIVIVVLMRLLPATAPVVKEIAKPTPPKNAAPEVRENTDAAIGTAPVAVVAMKAEHFDARRVVNDLYDTSGMSEAERTERELLRKLNIKGQAGQAAKELAPAEDPRILWNLAVAVRNPSVDAEVFKSVSELTPELRLAPIYIAALDSTRNRLRAVQLLRSISKKNLGTQQEPWLDWLNAERRVAASRSGT